MTVTIAYATQAHAEALAPNLRPEDAAEVLASGGFTPLEALTASLAASDEAFALLFDGEVVALWGVAPIRAGLLGPPVAGAVWLLGSPALSKHRRHWLRLCRPAVAGMLHRWGVLVNAVDARYGAALRWARWLGFTVGEPEPRGVNGEMFCRIEIRRTDLV